jgi:multidrug transporter EmrE-like cation transporter
MSWYGISTALLSGCLMLAMKIAEKCKKKSQMDGAGTSLSTEDTQTDGVETTQTQAKSAWKVLLLSILIAAGFGLVNGLGNYFITLGTKPGALGSSVTFPIVNGGTIVFSSLIGLIAFKEKITWKTWIGLALVVLSTTLFMFAQ